jgi:flagellar biosynthesis component FlhA
VESTAAVLADLVRSGKHPVLLCRAGLRPFLAEAITGAVPGAVVVSYPEVAGARDVQVVGQVQIEGAAA